MRTMHACSRRLLHRAGTPHTTSGNRHRCGAVRAGQALVHRARPGAACAQATIIHHQPRGPLIKTQGGMPVPGSLGKGLDGFIVDEDDQLRFYVIPLRAQAAYITNDRPLQHIAINACAHLPTILVLQRTKLSACDASAQSTAPGSAVLMRRSP